MTDEENYGQSISTSDIATLVNEINRLNEIVDDLWESIGQMAANNSPDDAQLTAERMWAEHNGEEWSYW